MNLNEFLKAYKAIPRYIDKLKSLYKYANKGFDNPLDPIRLKRIDMMLKHFYNNSSDLNELRTMLIISEGVKTHSLVRDSRNLLYERFIFLSN